MSLRKSSVTKEEHKPVSCTRCKSDVKNSDKGTQCETCENWFHIQCEDITLDQYKLMQKEESKILHWFCKDCSTLTLDTGKMLNLLKIKQEKLKEKVKQMETFMEDNTHLVLEEIKSVKEAIVDIDKRLTDYKLKTTKEDVISLIEEHIKIHEVKFVEKTKKELEPTWATVVAKHVDDKMAKVSGDLGKVQKVIENTQQVVEETKKKADEERDKENRATNIIIYRIPEQQGSHDETMKLDQQFCLDLFNSGLEMETKEGDFKSIFRLGKKGETCRPLLVQFRERSVKNLAMESLHKLRNAQDKFKNISITHDMTKLERSACKILIEEAKKKQDQESGEYYWRVRGQPGQMKVVRLHKH